VPLKISFETDIKGFERVEKALSSQNKLLNETAVSVDQLNSAKQQMVKGDMDLKGMESLKGTASAVNSLVGALDKLTRGQSGLRGFMSLFSEFSKQVKEFNSEGASSLLGGVDDRIKNLKESASSRIAKMTQLRTQSRIHCESGDFESANQLDGQIAGEANNLGLESQMLQKLKYSKFMNTPVSQMLGQSKAAASWVTSPRSGGAVLAGAETAAAGRVAGALGGITLGGMAAGAAAVATGGAVVAGAAYAGSEWWRKYSERDSRENLSRYSRERQIFEAGMGGDVARGKMLETGGSNEAQYYGGNFFRTKRGDFDMQQAGRNVNAFVRSGFGIFGSKSYEAARLEIANEVSELDRPMQYAINQSTKFAVKREQALDPLALRMGQKRAASELQALNEMNPSLPNGTGVLSMRMAAPNMKRAEAAGVFDLISPTGEAAQKSSSEAGTANMEGDTNRAISKAPTTWFNQQRRYGMSDNAVSESYRLAGWRSQKGKDPTEFANVWAKGLGQFGKLKTMAGREAASEYMAKQTSGIYGEIDPSQVTPVAAAITANAVSKGVAEPEAVKAGGAMQDYQNSMSKETGNIVSMGIDQASMSM